MSDQPRLNFVPVTYYEVEAYCFNAFINAVFGGNLLYKGTYKIREQEELSRDNTVTFHVQNSHTTLDYVGLGGWPATREMLQEACYRGLIPAGMYIVQI